MSVLREDEEESKINIKWIEGNNRVFSVYPPSLVKGNKVFVMKEYWIELACFVRDDLHWLLSLEHHVFWSHMIYSKNAHNLLISFLKGSPPNYMRNNFVMDKEMNAIFKEIEHLVFLVFLRLSTQKESENCFIENLGEILYNKYLFTVPILLDICTIYGTSNREMVEDMINRVVNIAPNFLIDFQEIVPQFLHVLSVVKEEFSTKHLTKVEEKKLIAQKVRDLVVYLYDAVVTIQVFLDLFMWGCTLFCHNDFINEIIIFYSNVLPELNNEFEKSCNALNQPFALSTLVENIRLDFLKIVKSIFDYVANEADKIQDKKDEMVDKYLNLMMELLAESAFLHDYDKLYSIKQEIESVTQKCANVDLIKVNHILEGTALALKEEKIRLGPVVSNCNKKNFENCQSIETEVSGIKLKSLITEVQDVFPHLTEHFVNCCLKYYQYNTEKVISAVLENSLPLVLRNFNSNTEKSPEDGKLENASTLKWDEPEAETLFECNGSQRNKYGNLREILEDKTEVNEMREWYKQFAIVADEIYDDEYDDTYDENNDVSVRDEEDIERDLSLIHSENSDESDNEETETEQNGNQSLFLQNPAELREQKSQKRLNKKLTVIRDGGQNRHRTLNTHFKETRKSIMGNHDRKRQASGKKKRGMIPS